jgi:hypothetical protein
MVKHDGGVAIKAIDAICKGKGWAMGQAKMTNAETGEITYYFSTPKIYFWQIRKLLWYHLHKRDIIKRRGTA